MKNELKLSCFLAVFIAVAAFVAGCDKQKETKTAAEAQTVENKADAKDELELKPTDMQVGNTAAAIDAKDPKVWSFLPNVVAEVNGKKITKQE